MWVFINTNHFGYRNYADYYLDRDYTRRLFDNRLVRISSEPLQRTTLEKIVKQKISVVPVREHQIETSKRVVKAVVPVGEEENIRKNANKVVEQVIAPAFAEKRKSFKGAEAKRASKRNKTGLFGSIKAGIPNSNHGQSPRNPVRLNTKVKIARINPKRNLRTK